MSGDFWLFADDFLQNQDNSKLAQDVNLGEQEDNENRIQILNSRFKWTPCQTQQTRNKYKKSSSRSIKYAEEAIEAANNHEDSRSLKLANMITAYAVDDGDLALGHWIRFKLLCATKPDDFRILLSELQSALRSPIPPKQIKTELKRKSQIDGISYTFNKQKLGQIVQEISDIVYQLYTNDKTYKNKMDSMKKFTKDVFKLKSPSQKAPALENFVEIKYHSSRGRHLVVTKDVPIGTTLLVEKPFVSGLTDVLELEINRCHHCYKVDFNPIPCQNCVFVLFCSKKCKLAAQKYHQFECKCFPHLFFLESMCHPQNWLVAFKMICNLGPRQLYKYFQQEQSISNENSSSLDEKVTASSSSSNSECEIKGFDPVTGIFDPCSLHTVRHIFKSAKSCNHSPFKPLVSIALCRILEHRTDFFQNLNLTEDKMINFQNWIAKIILETASSYTTPFYGNEDAICDEYNYGKGNRNQDQVLGLNELEFGGAKFSTASLISHSCNPNLIQVEYPNTKGSGIALLAKRDLIKGEELCKSYCPNFPFLDKIQRHEKLVEAGDEFTCDCVACLEDWPLLEQLESDQKDSTRPSFCCRRCSKSMKIEERRSENYNKIALISSNESSHGLKCPVCSALYSVRDLKSQLKRYSEILDGSKLVQRGKISEMIKTLKTASKFFHENLIPPSYLQIKCDDLLQKTIALSVLDESI